MRTTKTFSPNQEGWTIRRWVSLAVVLLAIVLILPLLYTGTFNHPSPLDDYDYAEWKSYPAMQAELYMGWSGRYFSNLALTLCPLHWHSFPAYRSACIILLVLFIISVWAVMRGGLRAYAKVPGYVASAIAAAGVLLMLNIMPSLAEGFFWYSSAVTHMISVILLAAFLLVVIRIDVGQNPQTSRGTYILMALLVVGIIGCNEISLILCDLLCLILWRCYRHWTRPDLERLYRTLCVVCLLCSAIAILAPGNAARQSVTGRDLWMVLPTWLYHTQKLSLSFLLDPCLLLFSSCFILLIGRSKSFRPVTNLLMAFALPFILVFMICLPPHYALGMPPPARVINMVYVVFIFGWIFFLLHLVVFLQEIWQNNAVALRPVKQIAILTVTILLIAGFNRSAMLRSNFFIVLKGLKMGIPQAYDAELEARYGLLKHSVGDTVAMPRIKTIDANILYFLDIGESCEMGTNKFYGRYWGKHCVYTY